MSDEMWERIQQQLAGGGELGPPAVGPQEAQRMLAFRKRLQKRMERGEAVRQRRGPQGGMQAAQYGPEAPDGYTPQTGDPTEPVELANDPRNQEPPTPQRGPTAPLGVPNLAGQLNAMDGMYRAQSVGLNTYADMKAKGMLPEGATMEDAEKVAQMHIPEKDGYTREQQVKSQLQGMVNARDPNYRTGKEIAGERTRARRERARRIRREFAEKPQMGRPQRLNKWEMRDKQEELKRRMRNRNSTNGSRVDEMRRVAMGRGGSTRRSDAQRRRYATMYR
jgi:hypothetical protein